MNCDIIDRNYIIEMMSIETFDYLIYIALLVMSAILVISSIIYLILKKEPPRIIFNVSPANNICDRLCITCSVGKGNFERSLMDIDDINALVETIIKSAEEGVNIVRISFAGAGEPTLNKKLPEMFDIIGKMISEWKWTYKPEIHLITNGATLYKNMRLQDAIIRNSVSIGISLGVTDVDEYGKVFFGDITKGHHINDVFKSLAWAAKMNGEGLLKLLIHLSPPGKWVGQFFDDTFSTIMKIIAENGGKSVNFMYFDYVADRVGNAVVENRFLGPANRIHTMNDCIKKGEFDYNINCDVPINVKFISESHIFYPTILSIIAVIIRCRWPCLWSGSTIMCIPDGKLVCCNDQHQICPFGHYALIESKKRDIEDIVDDMTNGKIPINSTKNIIPIPTNISKMRANKRKLKICESCNQCNIKFDSFLGVLVPILMRLRYLIPFHY